MSAADLPFGLRYDMPIEAYHSGPAVSKSGLDCIERSPFHYWAACIDPDRPPRLEPTPAMRLGTLVHCITLEPDCINDRYKIALRCDRRTTAGKTAWAAFIADLKPGQSAVDPELIEQAQAMAAAVRQIGPVRDLLAAGHAEVSAYWIDAPTGLPCRCRPDWVAPAGDGVILFDLKTAMDASPSGFAKAVANWGYAKQAAMYCDGWTAVTGQTVHGFVFGAVEKEYPFAAAAYMLDENALDQGRRQYRRNLATLKQCLESGEWPGYTAGDEIQLLQLPAWAIEKETSE